IARFSIVGATGRSPVYQPHGRTGDLPVAPTKGPSPLGMGSIARFSWPPPWLPLHPDLTFPAGHGVHRPDSIPRTTGGPGPDVPCGGRGRPSFSPCAHVGRGFPVGHGVHRSDLNSGGRTRVIDVYTWPTPNGHKVHIMLEEVGLPYIVHPIDIGRGDQFAPDFLKISPNNKMPAITDRDGPGGKPYSLFESGAILLYLAERTGKLMPAETGARYEVVQWLMFQMGNIGPMLGQAHHFRHYAPEPLPYAIQRYTNEANR